ncbi:MAG: hypothetical protein WAV22_07945 [Porticoccaceae bacterium]
MPGHGNAPPVLAGRGAGDYQKQPAQFTRKPRPAYAAQFRPDENLFAILCCGWPPVRPPARNVLALPPDSAPDVVDWRQLHGIHVFVSPPSGASAPHGLLRELGVELVRVGVESLILFDGEVCVSEFWRAGGERPGAAV